MKILKNNDFDVKISVSKLEGENFLRMDVRLPEKWGYDVIYRGYVGLSDDDDAAGFDIELEDENRCSFCLVPETQEERDFLGGEKFSYYNKDQCCWIFTPFSKTIPKTEWEVIEMEIVKE